jgi:hypothetical protein
LDPILVLPYRPAACELPHHETGQTKAPDHKPELKQKTLASNGASTHETQLTILPVHGDERGSATERSPLQLKRWLLPVEEQRRPDWTVS